VTSHLAFPEEQYRDLEQVQALEARVVAHVPLLDLQAEARGDVLRHGAQLVTEMTVRLAEESEGTQRLASAAGPWERKKVATAPAATMATMRSWTTRPLRSGWMPIQGTSGKGIGRGGR
jgi:hypothetical protein